MSITLQKVISKNKTKNIQNNLDSSVHRRNEERAQGVPWAPPMRSKMGPIRSKIGEKEPKWSGFVFYENTFSESKFRSKGADLFWHPQIAPMAGIKQKVIG